MAARWAASDRQAGWGPSLGSAERALEQTLALPREWHGSGSLEPVALRAIVHHARGTPEIRCSMETGCGKSTRLLSHLSRRHFVFSIDRGGSLSRARTSPILRSDSTTFVDGPTQLTLPRHSFDEKLQLALLDGPHAYPFREPLEVVDRTAFFRRTNAETFDPLADGWSRQGINRAMGARHRFLVRMKRVVFPRTHMPAFVRRLYWKLF